jgi:hypothetical protein
VKNFKPFSKSRRSRKSRDTTQAATEFSDNDSAADLVADTEVATSTTDAANKPKGKAVKWGNVKID